MRRLVYDGYSDRLDYYMVKIIYLNEDKLKLIHYAGDDFSEYYFVETDKYTATKTKWNDNICRELENEILHGKIEVYKKINYKISEYDGYCVLAKHFKDEAEYVWSVPHKVMYDGLKVGDSIYVDTYKGTKIAHITKIFKIRDSEVIPTKRVFEKTKIKHHFVTREELTNIKNANKLCNQ